MVKRMFLVGCYLVTRIILGCALTFLYLVSVSEAAAAFETNGALSEKDANGNAVVELKDVDIDKIMDVNSAIAVEKEIAADTLGTIFAATRGHFLPYVEESSIELVDLLTHYYEGIRKSATDSLLETVRTFYDLSNPPEWRPGKTSVSRRIHITRVNIDSVSRVSPLTIMLWS